MTRAEAIAVYLPVLDSRSVNFLKQHSGRLRVLWVLAPQLVQECLPVGETCSALDPKDVANAVQSLKLFGTVIVIDNSYLHFISPARICIIMADEEIAHAIANCYFSQYQIVFMPIDPA